MNERASPNNDAAGIANSVCLVCGATSCERYAISAARMRDALSVYYGEKIPPSVQFDDCRLMRCESCSLEFADPLTPGSSGFYEWITAHPGYYPETRWEWNEVRECLRGQPKPHRLLEIGCGDGRFLESLRGLDHVECAGVDSTLSSVEKCRARGVAAHAGTIENYLRDQPEAAGSYDSVVAFHCLEHVADPAGLVARMLDLLAPAGRLFLSTPFSPMSFENLWFDPLNHPPHHMTRWNVRSYEALARRFGLAVSFQMPVAPPLRRRIATSFNLRLNGPRRCDGPGKILFRAMLRPHLLIAEILRQLRRPRVNGVPAADLVLAEFQRVAP